MSSDSEFHAILKISSKADDETASEALLALLTSAAYEEHPEIPLSQIYHLISKSGSSRILDPLNTLSLLLPLAPRDPAAKDIISLLGECSPAKEVVMAAQEATERLDASLNADEVDDENEDGKSLSSPVLQLIILLELYSTSIPRLKLRVKSAAETIRPLLYEVADFVDSAGPRASRDEGRSLIAGVTTLVNRVMKWAGDVSGDNEDEMSDVKIVLKDLLDRTLTACAHCVRSSIAQRTFEICFPRLTVRSAMESGWEEGEQIVLAAIGLYDTLGVSSHALTSQPTAISLIVHTYSSSPATSPDHLLSFLLPIIVASIQSNTLLDESLAVLLRSLHQLKGASPTAELLPTVITQLSVVLPPLSSAHPDPSVRHQAFRVISLLVSLSPQQQRVQLLIDMNQSEFPQMRVAAVGLVKEAVLEALGSGSTAPNVFSSPTLLQIFGPMLFKPSPPDLFERNISLNDFQDSQEPQRLVECLALYYVILQRDRKNRTGIRNKDVLSSVEHSLLLPLRSFLDKWTEDLDFSKVHLHAMMPLVSLKVSLERVDNARAAIN